MLTLMSKNNRQRNRGRVKVKGSSSRPRISVFRSNNHIYLQFIDDEKGKTVLSFDDQALDKKDLKKTKKEKAQILGLIAGKEALKKGIERAVFDKNKFKYHGRVKALADGLREAGIIF